MSNFDKMYYLASPYTHKDKKIKKKRAVTAREYAIKLMKMGLNVFSPISYNESWEDVYDMPGDWNFWEKIDKGYIRRMDCIVVLTIDGYKQSVGVTAEIEYAKEIGKPVFYISPEQIDSGEINELLKFELS